MAGKIWILGRGVSPYSRETLCEVGWLKEFYITLTPASSYKKQTEQWHEGWLKGLFNINPCDPTWVKHSSQRLPAQCLNNWARLNLTDFKSKAKRVCSYRSSASVLSPLTQDGWMDGWIREFNFTSAQASVLKSLTWGLTQGWGDIHLCRTAVSIWTITYAPQSAAGIDPGNHRSALLRITTRLTAPPHRSGPRLWLRSCFITRMTISFGRCTSYHFNSHSHICICLFDNNIYVNIYYPSMLLIYCFYVLMSIDGLSLALYT